MHMHVVGHMQPARHFGLSMPSRKLSPSLLRLLSPLGGRALPAPDPLSLGLRIFAHPHPPYEAPPGCIQLNVRKIPHGTKCTNTFDSASGPPSEAGLTTRVFRQWTADQESSPREQVGSVPTHSYCRHLPSSESVPTLIQDRRSHPQQPCVPTQKLQSPAIPRGPHAGGHGSRQGGV
jgi:hypothetical protein